MLGLGYSLEPVLDVFLQALGRNTRVAICIVPSNDCEISFLQSCISVMGLDISNLLPLCEEMVIKFTGVRVRLTNTSRKSALDGSETD
jgi:hypothetical protein